MTEDCRQRIIQKYVPRNLRPQLHSMLHRYGLPKGVPEAEQLRARNQLADALAAAFEAGNRAPPLP